MRNINPDQLRMLYTASELKNGPSIDLQHIQKGPESKFGGHWKSEEHMWATKHRENKASGLDKDVAENGVREPLTMLNGPDVDGSVLGNGHHRVLAAYKANPNQYLAVEHEKHFE